MTPRKSARAEAFISQHKIFVSVTVILELEWVLRSRYAFAPKLVAQALEKITTLANVVVGERMAIRQVLKKLIDGQVRVAEPVRDNASMLLSIPQYMTEFSVKVVSLIPTLLLRFKCALVPEGEGLFSSLSLRERD